MTKAMKILLSTYEGYPKDRSVQNKKKFLDKNGVLYRNGFLHFSGNDAPVKAAKALIEKYGITPEELGLKEQQT